MNAQKQDLRKPGLWAGLCLLMLVLAAPAAWCQGSGQSPSQGQGQSNPPKPAEKVPPDKPTVALEPPAPAVNPEEEAALKAFMDVKPAEAPKLVQLGEEFLKKYPETRYAGGVYARLTTAYLSTGQEDKVFAAGDKALEFNPDNVDVLALLAMVLPRRVDMRSLDAQQKLQKAETYAQRVMAVLSTLPKPEGLSEEDFTRAKNDKLALAHGGLGFINFQRQKFAESAAELEQAVKLASSPDPVDYYVLGLAGLNSRRYADAIAAFGHCAEVSGAMQDRCKKAGEEAKKVAAAHPSAPAPKP